MTTGELRGIRLWRVVLAALLAGVLTLGQARAAPGPAGEDATWPLLHSALERMREVLPHPAFLLVTGDLLAHSYREKFSAAASDHSDAPYRAFVVKTVAFLAGQMQGKFPGIPILPALGNNDSDCGDYMLQPGGPFLHDTVPIVRAMLGDGSTPGFDADWTALGNYNVAHPRLAGVRVIFVDTVLFSRKYRDVCGGGSDPAGQTLAWLAAQLSAAREAGQKVWLIYHIPPGIDVYATLQHGGCPEAIVPMWASAPAAHFAALMRDFADFIAVSLAGHTHMDEFRLTGAPGAHDGFVLVTPALSPIFGQNPAFQVIAHDAGGAILDRTTHYVANLPAAAAAGAPPEWREEPSFTAAWQLPRVDLAALETLAGRISADRAEATRWLLRYSVARPEYWPLPPARGLVPDQTLAAYRCSIGNVSVPDFQACYCGGPPH